MTASAGPLGGHLRRSPVGPCSVRPARQLLRRRGWEEGVSVRLSDVLAQTALAIAVSRCRHAGSGSEKTADRHGDRVASTGPGDTWVTSGARARPGDVGGHTRPFPGTRSPLGGRGVPGLERPVTFYRQARGRPFPRRVYCRGLWRRGDGCRTEDTGPRRPATDPGSRHSPKSRRPSLGRP